MRLKLKRLYHDENSTIGALFVDNFLIGFTCEDEPREEKIAGETRIPAGIYPLAIRKGSPMAKKYDERFSGLEHDGMIWIKDIPGFEYVYFHVGNTEADSEGCILVGLGADVATMTISRSRDCYRQLYLMVRQWIEKEDCFLTVEDEG